ncbi:MAG: hypothetical protein ACRC68_06775, partial [Clostridium sp.]
MMLLNWIIHEIKLQVINGLYGVYIIVNLVYIFLLGYVPDEYVDVASTFIIFSDPTVLGLIFIGAFILLEGRSSVIQGIGITPLGTRNYILGKVISMQIIGIVTSLIIAITYKGFDFNIGLLIITILIGSMVFTMMGILASAYCRNINDYLLIISVIGVVLALPAINFLGVNFKLLNIIPTYSVVNLVWQSITNISYGNISINIIVLIIWCCGLMIVTEKAVNYKLFRG